jgi:hypothetical protein
MTKHNEFGGPVGTLLTTISLPFVIYSLYFLCDEEFCVSFDWKNELNWDFLWAKIQKQNLLDYTGLFIFLGWMLFHVVLERLLPGEIVYGVELPEKKGRLPYRMSGHLQFWLTLLLMGHCIPIFNITGDTIWSSSIAFHGFRSLPLQLLYDNYLSLITASILFSFMMSFYLYFSSFAPKGKLFAAGGNSGYPTYDFFMGRYDIYRIL